MAVATGGASIERNARHRSVVLAIVFGRLVRRRRIQGGAEQRSAAFQLFLAIAIAEEPVVTNPFEPLWQDMEQEPADELIGGERHGGDTISVSLVLPAEANFVIVDGDQTVVGDGDPMGVAPDVLEDLLWAAKGSLRVDDPFRSSCWEQMAQKCRAVVERLQSVEEGQLAGQERLLQTLQEQPAEEAREHPDGKKKAWPAGDPSLAVGREAATRNDTVQVGVMG